MNKISKVRKLTKDDIKYIKDSRSILFTNDSMYIFKSDTQVLDSINLCDVVFCTGFTKYLLNNFDFIGNILASLKENDIIEIRAERNSMDILKKNNMDSYMVFLVIHRETKTKGTVQKKHLLREELISLNNTFTGNLSL